MKKYWFKTKTYGWGWTPATWQGWLILVVFVVLLVFNFRRIDHHSHSASDTLINFVPQSVLLFLVFILICFLTGEKPGWRWGEKKDKK